MLIEATRQALVTLPLSHPPPTLPILYYAVVVAVAAANRKMLTLLLPAPPLWGSMVAMAAPPWRGRVGGASSVLLQAVRRG